MKFIEFKLTIANRNTYFSFQSPGYQDQLLHDYLSTCEPMGIYNLIRCAYLYEQPGEIISN